MSQFYKHVRPLDTPDVVHLEVGEQLIGQLGDRIPQERWARVSANFYGMLDSGHPLAAQIARCYAGWATKHAADAGVAERTVCGCQGGLVAHTDGSLRPCQTCRREDYEN